MKKVYSIILSIAALFTVAFTATAQEPGPYSIAKQITDPKNGNKPPEFPEATYKPVQVDEDNKIAFAKNISKPFKDGTYWIKLESFATGEASYKMSAEPADIVLVLDFSGSMTNYNVSRGNYYVPVNADNGYAYSNNFWTASGATSQRFYKVGDRYYQVKRDRVASGNTFVNPRGQVIDEYYQFLYIDTSIGRLYFDDMSLVKEMPTKYTNQDNNAPIWNGSLLRYYNNTAVSRLNALKAAVSDFIEVIYHNDNYEDDGFDKPRSTPLGNRISIVTYSSVANTHILLDGWTDVSTPAGDRNAEALIKAFVAAGTANQTHADAGMENANTLLAQIKTAEDQTRWNNASRTVVMFTDGAPGESLNWTDPVSSNVANDCIEFAQDAKTTYKATVFSVLVGSESGLMGTYMNAVSSNYPEATALDDLGNVCTDSEYYSGEKEYLYKENAGFYKFAGSDLSSVFEEIARQSGGDSNTSLTAATSTVDIVSDSFTLPEGLFEEGADVKDFVKVFTAELDEIDNGEYVFKEEIMAPYSTDTYDEYEKGVLKREDVDVDAAISVALDGQNKIKVSGFDYANNWCGPVMDESGEIIDYQGHKLIIMIPIKTNTDAVGGPDVLTNIVGSGIVLPGQTEPFISFESPTVSLPVNLHIEKIGLKPGESAKFKIERAEIPLEGSWSLEEIKNWKYVTSVFVTQPQGADPSNNPVVKVRGMASVGKDSNNQAIGYVYRITEEDWSWSYQRDETPQYTVSTKVNNPFTFTNSKKTELEYKLRHAESKATNVFKKEGGEERYDDSKKNERGNADTENPTN